MRYPLSVSDGWTNGSIKRFLDLRSPLTTDVGEKIEITNKNAHRKLNIAHCETH
jgi:hypothetical protein